MNDSRNATREAFNAWLDAEFDGIRLTDAEVNAMQAAFNAGASLPSAEPTTTNQCDGCRAEFTLDGDMHRWPDGMPYMICSRKRYITPSETASSEGYPGIAHGVEELNGARLVSVRRRGSPDGPIIACTLRAKDGDVVMKLAFDESSVMQSAEAMPSSEQIGWLCHHADGGRHFVWKDRPENEAEERAWIEKRYVRYEPAFVNSAPSPTAGSNYPAQHANEDGWTDWISPTDIDMYGLQCCDCGLKHEMQFRVMRNKAYTNDGVHWHADPVQSEEGYHVAFRMRRADKSLPSTAAVASGETPRTDAACFKAYREDGMPLLNYVVDGLFACQLERELAALGKDYERLLKESAEELKAARSSTATPSLDDYPNMAAILNGTIAGDFRDWTAVRWELYNFIRNCRSGLLSSATTVAWRPVANGPQMLRDNFGHEVSPNDFILARDEHGNWFELTGVPELPATST